MTPELRKALRGIAKTTASAEFPDLTEFELGINLLSDDELLAINVASLGHDYYTDILTFELERGVTSIEAEVYISVDRASDNAKRARVEYEEELRHLVVHGILHLAGYDDHDPIEKKRMRARERFHLLPA